MTIQERIDRLKQAVKEQTAQRDWLQKVDWKDSHTDVDQAAKEHDRIIEMYEKLISDLEARR